MYITRDDEGPHRRGAAQLAGARRALHLRLDGRAHPRPRRHRRQRHGHPDRQAAALHGLRRGAARRACCRCCSTSARPTTRCAPIRSISACARSRPPTTELDELVEEFVQAVQEVFPGCCIHFEDWKGTDAIRMLEPLSRQGALLQRRHPGHGQRRARGADDGAADHRRAADRAAHPVPRRRLGRDRHRQPDRLGDADEGALAGRGAQPHLHVRHQRAAGAVPHRSVARRRRSTRTRQRPRRISSRPSRR